MNSVIECGWLGGDPEVRYSAGNNPLCIARFSIGVPCRVSGEDEPKTNFFRCVCFGRLAEHVERYYRKGTKVIVRGRLNNESYVNKDGVKVSYTEIIVEEAEFAESKKASEGSTGSNNSNANRTAGSNRTAQNSYSGGGFMNIPDGIDEELPFMN